MNTNAAAAAQTNDNLLTLIALYGGRACRDNEGNLRELTDTETSFGKALRAEAKVRGLL